MAHELEECFHLVAVNSKGELEVFSTDKEDKLLDLVIKLRPKSYRVIYGCAFKDIFDVMSRSPQEKERLVKLLQLANHYDLEQLSLQAGVSETGATGPDSETGDDGPDAQDST